MRRFHYEGTAGPEVVLNKEESAHILKVFRMKKGDPILLFDDTHSEYYCEIVDTMEGRVCAKVVHKTPGIKHPNVHVTVYQAVLKGDKLEYAVQKCVELGASAFCPFVSKRCVRIPDEEGKKKLTRRLERIILEAVKQCGCVRVPKVYEAVPFERLIEKIPGHELTLFAYEGETEGLRSLPGDVKDVALVIGPEGGFEDGEARRIIGAGAKSISLGSRILRADTAAIALTAIVGHLLFE